MPRYLLYNKPCGVTSFEALYPVKKALKTGKVGHTGTLDKFASGLLIVLEGRALKLARFFSNCDKRYQALVRFGQETGTLDTEGEIVAEAPPPPLPALEQALGAFRGAIMQKPPAYSAIHIDGKRAYKLARGKKADVDNRIAARPVTIYQLELVSYAPEEDGKTALAEISVHCSSGTYIRSLGRDIARACGSRAYLAALRRTAIGGFSLDNASGPDDFLFRPVDRDCFSKLGIPSCGISAAAAQFLRHGRPLAHIQKSLAIPPGAECLALFSGNEMIALIEKQHDMWVYSFVNNVK
ncbi:MAG: tRNA pseudouridine(55) synthase TruB [Spirochaetaceae bacterium]|jgi:tRNA pseudouridine55 synthase|nr:tRNA pseudouridine(55) synthase TruB [Spirochaetaceae bacterium]